MVSLSYIFYHVAATDTHTVPPPPHIVADILYECSLDKHLVVLKYNRATYIYNTCSFNDKTTEIVFHLQRMRLCCIRVETKLFFANCPSPKLRMIETLAINYKFVVI